MLQTLKNTRMIFFLPSLPTGKSPRLTSSCRRRRHVKQMPKCGCSSSSRSCWTERTVQKNSCRSSAAVAPHPTAAWGAAASRPQRAMDGRWGYCPLCRLLRWWVMRRALCDIVPTSARIVSKCWTDESFTAQLKSFVWNVLNCTVGNVEVDLLTVDCTVYHYLEFCISTHFF